MLGGYQSQSPTSSHRLQARVANLMIAPVTCRILSTTSRHRRNWIQRCRRCASPDGHRPGDLRSAFGDWDKAPILILLGPLTHDCGRGSETKVVYERAGEVTVEQPIHAEVVRVAGPRAAPGPRVARSYAAPDRLEPCGSRRWAHSHPASCDIFSKRSRVWVTYVTRQPIKFAISRPPHGL